MAYSKPKKAIAERSKDLEPDALGPGLLPGEAVVVLDGGALVAVSVATDRAENGAGVSFIGQARCITPDGTSMVCGHGKTIHTGFSYSADAATIALYGVPALTKEMLLLMLGEELTMVEKKHPDEGEDPVLEPIINWGADVRLNASIRHAMSCADETSNPVTAANLLFQ